MSHTKDTLLCWHTVVGHLQKGVPVGVATWLERHLLTLCCLTFHISEFCCSAPRPPCLQAAIAVDGSCAGDCYILSLIGIDAGRIVHDVEPFPTSLHEGIESRLIGKE